MTGSTAIERTGIGLCRGMLTYLCTWRFTVRKVRSRSRRALRAAKEWMPCMQAMIQDGISDFYECGPMKQLKATDPSTKELVLFLFFYNNVYIVHMHIHMHINIQRERERKSG